MGINSEYYVVHVQHSKWVVACPRIYISTNLNLDGLTHRSPFLYSQEISKKCFFFAIIVDYLLVIYWLTGIND